jgi:hypothetical protein
LTLFDSSPDTSLLTLLAALVLVGLAWWWGSQPATVELDDPRFLLVSLAALILRGRHVARAIIGFQGHVQRIVVEKRIVRRNHIEVAVWVDRMPGDLPKPLLFEVDREGLKQLAHEEPVTSPLLRRVRLGIEQCASHLNCSAVGPHSTITLSRVLISNIPDATGTDFSA